MKRTMRRKSARRKTMRRKTMRRNNMRKTMRRKNMRKKTMRRKYKGGRFGFRFKKRKGDLYKSLVSDYTDPLRGQGGRVRGFFQLDKDSSPLAKGAKKRDRKRRNQESLRTFGRGYNMRDHQEGSIYSPDIEPTGGRQRTSLFDPRMRDPRMRDVTVPTILK